MRKVSRSLPALLLAAVLAGGCESSDSSPAPLPTATLTRA